MDAMTKSIHPLAIAYLEALKAMHDDEYSVASAERYRDARVALFSAGIPIHADDSVDSAIQQDPQYVAVHGLAGLRFKTDTTHAGDGFVWVRPAFTAARVPSSLVIPWPIIKETP